MTQCAPDYDWNICAKKIKSNNLFITSPKPKPSLHRYMLEKITIIKVNFDQLCFICTSPYLLGYVFLASTYELDYLCDNNFKSNSEKVAKIWRNLTNFHITKQRQIKFGDFVIFLWPSENIWTSVKTCWSLEL